MRHSLLLLSLTSMLLAACQAKPKLAATGSGDLSNPPAPRLAPDAELVGACGDGSLTTLGESVLSRRPYLQQLGADGTEVALAVNGDAAVTIDVTLPDGTPVTSVEAVDTVSVGQSRQLVASVEALSPEKIHCYSVRGLTEPAGFRTAPEGKSSTPVRFAAIGDSGSGDWYQQAVFKRMMTVPFDLVLHMGDLAYDSGTRSELEAEFFRAYPRMLRSFSVFPVIGNHDQASHQAAAYLEAFHLPRNGSASVPERYYSFDWGDVHFAALDTEHIDAEQAAWLEADLSATQRSWKVVYGHRPPHSSGEHGPNSAFKQRFVPIIERQGVKLVLSGHEHDYERFEPINGVTYVVTGGGGRDTRPVSSGGMTAYSEDVLHFVYVEIDGDVLTLHAIDGVGREFDSARIEKS